MANWQAVTNFADERKKIWAGYVETLERLLGASENKKDLRNRGTGHLQSWACGHVVKQEVYGWNSV